MPPARRVGIGLGGQRGKVGGSHLTTRSKWRPVGATAACGLIVTVVVALALHRTDKSPAGATPRSAAVAVSTIYPLESWPGRHAGTDREWEQLETSVVQRLPVASRAVGVIFSGRLLNNGIVVLQQPGSGDTVFVSAYLDTGRGPMQLWRRRYPGTSMAPLVVRIKARGESFAVILTTPAAASVAEREGSEMPERAVPLRDGVAILEKPQEGTVITIRAGGRPLYEGGLDATA